MKTVRQLFLKPNQRDLDWRDIILIGLSFFVVFAATERSYVYAKQVIDYKSRQLSAKINPKVPKRVLGVASVRGKEIEAQKRQIPDYISQDIFIVYDGKTFVINPAQIDLFIRRCDVEGQKLYCVKVGSIRSFIESKKNIISQGSCEKDVLTNNKGTYTYCTRDQGIDYDEMVNQIVTILTQRIEVYEIIEEHSVFDSKLGKMVLDEASLMSSVRGEEGVKGFNNLQDVGLKNSTGLTNNARNSVGNIDVQDGRQLMDIFAVKSRIEPVYKEVPATNGKYADKYIEIDHSQQHLYAWENGEVIYDWEVSGVLDHYAVFGVFQIYEMAPQAWSDIAEKWMPFWMAYYWDPKQEAWFGLHGLVWWEDSEGVHYESEDSIGKKKSGGCIRVTVDQAEVLYNWTYSGMPVLIHP
jgi:lipoprotein-anchoring transpeptidase ErfK/SrfK